MYGTSRSSPEMEPRPKAAGRNRLSFMLIYIESGRKRVSRRTHPIAAFDILVIVNPQVAARQKSANDASREPNPSPLFGRLLPRFRRLIGRGRSGALCPLVIRIDLSTPVAS